ncbi:uncharacterized protein C8R40DRAFT_781764 [Lentinula edodes]|uniref:uncharacterized protein n=1 Tax=Lentinula edodes TaxID=5353 RepID=UPI001E8D8C63|nr:uncharacterized protein C8R40DRAFT_781764 [Lentinula edodes]KAH7878681.1 hypothetical protein C8R40DRAFT_781764 [Lentinula edodes]
MSRWTQYDEDSYRLPEGMERIGYDSDSGKYIFRDRDGSVWQGPEGAEYGEMTRVSGSSDQEAQAVMEEPSVRADGYQPLATDIHSDAPLAFRRPVNANAYRTLAPFFLLIGVVLLLVWKLTHSGWSTSPSPCPANATTPYMIQPGDYCWDIARSHNCTLEELESLNPAVDCGTLRPGAIVCLPKAMLSSS